MNNPFFSLIYGDSTNQCKKFAKSELKVCIEEFEEKFSKVHQEKKEQEETTKNAEAHRHRIGSPDEFLATKEGSQKSEQWDFC
jgi:condensin complex subunit 1